MTTIAGLLVAAGLWSYLAPYEVVVKFLVAGAAIFVMFGISARHYAFAVVFGVPAVLFNPVAPMFSFSPDWQRLLLATSTIPFIASLCWRNLRRPHHE
jgi:uncharacterized membrane protein YccC